MIAPGICFKSAFRRYSQWSRDMWLFPIEWKSELCEIEGSISQWSSCWEYCCQMTCSGKVMRRSTPSPLFLFFNRRSRRANSALALVDITADWRTSVWLTEKRSIRWNSGLTRWGVYLTVSMMKVHVSDDVKLEGKIKNLFVVVRALFISENLGKMLKNRCIWHE